MKIVTQAVAGTLESCDALVHVEPHDNGIILELDSVVEKQFGEQIRRVILETLELLGVANAKITVVDRGALDCTLKARVTAVVHRSSDQEFLWKGAGNE